MRRLFFIVIAIFLTNLSFAQTENYQTAIDDFQTNYNREKYNVIFNAFSSEMQQALPLDKTKKFLAGLKSQVGKIENKAFIGFQKGTYATYKTQFEKAVLAVNISLDKQNKINGLFIKPYIEPKETNSINALMSYPQQIAEIIYLYSQDFPNHTQLSIAITRKGLTSYYGIIKENDSIKPINNRSKIFEIGSVTKVFTSVVLASLVAENKIALTDNINAYYPFTFNDSIKISFESLANHTSGLPRLPENFDISNGTNPYKNYGKRKLEEYLKNIMKLENEPSRVYSYSNLGVGLLAYTLGLSQKTSFQELLQKRIFDKYKMTSSFMRSENLGDRLVKGLNTKGKVVPNWDFDALFGAGGVLSTAEDLTKFAIAQFNPDDAQLALTRIPTFKVNENMKIGLGWHLLKSKSGQNLIWHNGGTGGYTSSIAVDVKNKLAIIILSNVSAFDPNMKNIDKLCFELMNYYNEEKLK